MNSILQTIYQQKQEEVARLKQYGIPDDFEKQPSRDFIKALSTDGSPSVIAEIKKASPSRGLLCKEFEPAVIAREYADAGARCLSVLTDQKFFQGQYEDLLQAKKACNLPVLRKDFLIDPVQIMESHAFGADCILLIVALLDSPQLKDFCQMAQDLNMAVLVESHTEAELEKALALPTPLIGINNRSLHTFETDLQTSIHLKKYIPSHKIPIAESGIHTRDDILLLQSSGIHTFLIGESLMKSPHRGDDLRNLIAIK